MTNVIVICSECGTCLYDDGELNSCKHIDLEQMVDFYFYLNKAYSSQNKYDKLSKK